MAYSLACRDIGVDCEYVAKGDTMEQMIADGGKHAARQVDAKAASCLRTSKAVAHRSRPT